MNKRNLKLIMELIFIFIIPLLILCINCNYSNTIEYDNNGNYQETEKHINFNVPFTYDNGYINRIDNFNLNNSKRNGYFYNSNNVLYKGNNNTTISNDNGISVYNNTTYYLYVDTPIIPNYILCWICDNNNNILDYQVKDINDTYTPTTSGYLYYTIEYGNQIINVNDVKININKSQSWANGNYVPYGEPLILITNTDISGQNKINYTIWGKIKQLIIDNLQLQDNVIIDIVITYTILWFIMFVIWHFIYLFFDGLVHIFIDWGHKEKVKVS